MLNEQLVAKRFLRQQVFTSTKFYEYEKNFLHHAFTDGRCIYEYLCIRSTTSLGAL